MTANIGSARILIEGDDSGIRKLFGGLGKTIGAALVGAGVAVTGFAVKGIRDFASLEQGMNEVFTLLPGATEAAMAQMTADLRGFSREMGIVTDEAVPALYQAISAGIPEENVFTFLEIAARAAVGGATDLETAVDGLTTVTNAWGIGAEGAEAAADALFTGMRLGKTTIGELSSEMSTVAPMASNLGVSFEEAIAAASALTLGGVSTSEAMNQTRAAMVAMSKPSKAMTDAWNALGFESGRAAIETLGFQGAIEGLRGFADDAGVEMVTLTGRVEGANAILGLTGPNADRARTALDEMANSAGATDAAFDRMDQGLARTWERIRINAADAFLSVGNALAPFVQTMADKLLPVVEKLADKLPDFLDKVIGGFESLSGVVSGIFSGDGFGGGDFFSGILEGIQNAVLGAVEWLAAGGLNQILERFIAFRTRLFDAALKLFSALVEAIVVFAPQIINTLVTQLIPAIVSTIVEAVPVLLNAAVDLLGALVEAAQQILPVVLDAALNLILSIVGLLPALIPLLLEAAINLLLAIVEAVPLIIPPLLTAVLGLIPAIINTLSNSIPVLIQGAIQLFLALVQAIPIIIPLVIVALIEAIPQIVEALIGAIPQIIMGAIQLFTGLVDGLEEAIPALISALVALGGQLVATVLGFGPKMLQAGKKLFSSIGDGIKGAVSGVTSAISGGLSKLRNLLPFSPAKEGPLAGSGDLMRAGEKMMERVAEGVKARASVVSKSVEAALSQASRLVDLQASRIDQRLLQTATAAARQTQALAQSAGQLSTVAAQIKQVNVNYYTQPTPTTDTVRTTQAVRALI